MVFGWNSIEQKFCRVAKSKKRFGVISLNKGIRVDTNSIIDQVEFGHIAAEQETEELNEYFVETSEYKSLLNDPRKILVVGRKGSGKSAIYFTLQKRFENQVKGLDLDNYPWAVHKQLRDESGVGDYAYVNTWRYMILVELAKYILNYSDPKRYRIADPNWWRLKFDANLRKLRRFLIQNYGTTAPSFVELLVSRAREIKKLNIRGLSAESAKAEGRHAQLLNSINIVTHDLEKLVFAKLPSNRSIYILFDQLDRGWDNTARFKEMLIGLILAARSLTDRARKFEKNLHIVVFLRSDIYARLRFEDKNKIYPDIVTLEWDDENLMSMINRRVRVSANKGWADVVTRDRVHRQMKPFDYIIKRTMLRPRDLISFCNYALKGARDSGHSVIERSDIYEGEKNYSDHIKREFQDETQGDYKDSEYIDKLFDVLRAIHVNKFSKQTFIEIYKDLHEEEMPDDPEEVLEYLIELSILGVYKIGGRGGGSRVLYRYKMPPEATIEPAGDLIVHPSLKHSLDLKEFRSSS